MGEETKVKSNIEKFRDSKTPEELQALQLKWLAAGRAAKVKKRAEREAQEKEIQKKAEDLVPQILAHSFLALDDDKYVPPPDQIQKVRALLDAPNMTMEKLRTKFFPTMTDKAWAKLSNFIHNYEAPNIESVSAQLFAAKRKHLKRTAAFLREIKKQVKAAKLVAEEKYGKGRGMVSTKLLEQLHAANEAFFSADLEVAKFAQKTEDSKQVKTQAIINIHHAVPRPAPIIDVTPPRESLSDLLSKKS